MEQRNTSSSMRSILDQISQHDFAQKHTLLVDNFLCKAWNVYYNLHNPESFEDPDNLKNIRHKSQTCARRE
jgi:hypothetical protein